MPLVSIGLPVYNGENYLSEALDSLLRQTFRDFELIISDNASSDRTRDICQAYAKIDNRVRYFRSNHNFGAAWNFNRVFKLSSGKYFKWAAHDDICAEDFLMKCVNVLDTDPSVLLCHSRVEVIDSKGNIIMQSQSHPHCSINFEFEKELENISDTVPNKRFADLIRLSHPCIDIFGVIRYEALKRTCLIGNYLGADRNLLAELSLIGRFYRVPEYLFLLRFHEKRSVAITDYKVLTLWFDTQKKRRDLFPLWKNFFEYIRSIWRARIGLDQKFFCAIHLFHWTVEYRRTLICNLKSVVEEFCPKGIFKMLLYIKRML